MARFVIKHKSSGKFFHPYMGQANPDNNTQLVLYEGTHERMHFFFDVVDAPWGYIRHATSGKIIHPYGGSIHPGDDTNLVLHQDRHAGALFCIDSANDTIIHKGGKFAYPKGGSHNPGNQTVVCLHGSQHYSMKFECVSPYNTSEEVLVYGVPTLRGRWEIINLVMDPAAIHKQTVTYKVGKSITESTSSSFNFKWEMTVGATAGVNFLLGSASVTTSMSTSLSTMFKRTSSATWSEETTVTREITVSPGNSVVTWQFVFECEQHDHKAVFKSNILADTQSPRDIPDEIAGVGF